MSIRIDVSKSVHTRLLKYGYTFAQRVNNLLACDEVILKPVVAPMSTRMSIRVTPEAHKELLIMQERLGCMSISNVLESALNTNPSHPFVEDLQRGLDDQPINKSVKVKSLDHEKLKAIAARQGLPIWLAFHNILEAYKDEED